MRKLFGTSSRNGEIYRVPEQPFLTKGGKEKTGNIDAALREKRNDEERRPNKNAIGSACTPPMRSSSTPAKRCCVRPAVVRYVTTTFFLHPEKKSEVISASTVTHLGVLLACSSPASASPSEDLATLDNDALLKMAPEVQGDSRLMAWRQEKEERRQALAREAAGQKPLPRPVQTGEEKSFLPPVTTTASSPDAIRLAQHLKEIGAVMYGGYGCMHCYRQKQLLGAEVVNSLLTYVECGKNGANSKRELCKEKGVKGFPTWEIDGQMYPGEQSLSDLAKASKFELRTVENKQK